MLLDNCRLCSLILVHAHPCCLNLILVRANTPDAYEAFRIEPRCGILKTQLNTRETVVKQIISVYFTARRKQQYECQLLLEGLLGEPPISIVLSGEGSYDGKYEAIVDI
jgi:hypothetical protein